MSDDDPTPRDDSETRDVAARMALVLRLRARGVASTDVLRALETVPRGLFAPHRYADLAWRDVALPIACGQTMPEPSYIAETLQALDLAPGRRVLEIGAGSGYATALIAKLAGPVVALERYRSLADEARARLASLRVANAQVLCADGLAPDPGLGLFDRIIAHGEPPHGPAPWLAMLAQGGAILFARRDADGLFLVAQTDGPSGLVERRVRPSRLPRLTPGVAARL